MIQRNVIAHDLPQLIAHELNNHNVFFAPRSLTWRLLIPQNLSHLFVIHRLIQVNTSSMNTSEPCDLSKSGLASADPARPSTPVFVFHTFSSCTDTSSGQLFTNKDIRTLSSFPVSPGVCRSTQTSKASSTHTHCRSTPRKRYTQFLAAKHLLASAYQNGDLDTMFVKK